MGFFGVVMQQEGFSSIPWNEWVAKTVPPPQAGTLDTLGRAVVPRTTTQFHILATGSGSASSPGIYVDGIWRRTTAGRFSGTRAGGLEGTTALSF